MRVRLLATLLFATACTTATAPPPQQAARPADFTLPAVMVRPFGSLSCGLGQTAPLLLGVRVSNRAAESIMIRTIRLTTPEGQEISFEPQDHAVNGFLEASQTEVFPVKTNVRVAPDCKTPYRAKSIRAQIEFEVRGTRFWETFELANIPL